MPSTDHSENGLPSVKESLQTVMRILHPMAALHANLWTKHGKTLMPMLKTICIYIWWTIKLFFIYIYELNNFFFYSSKHRRAQMLPEASPGEGWGKQKQPKPLGQLSQYEVSELLKAKVGWSLLFERSSMVRNVCLECLFFIIII